MTEQEWLESDDPLAMLSWLNFADEPVAQRVDREPRISDRKLRLIACAFCRIHIREHQPGDDIIVRSFEDGDGRSGIVSPRGVAAAVEMLQGPADEAVAWWVSCVPVAHRARFADAVRDIVANPFRPVIEWNAALYEPRKHGAHGRFMAECRTPTVMSLATAAYEERNPENGTLDPARLGILADALEEAGCTDELLLNHLRSRKRCPRCGGKGTVYTGFSDVMGPTRHCDDMQGAMPGPACGNTGWVPTGDHYRGCWAVDLVLGRS